MSDRARYLECSDPAMGSAVWRFVSCSRLTIAMALLHLLAASVCNAQSQPDSPQAMLRAASEALKAEKLDEAIKLAKKAGEVGRQDATIQQRAAEILFLSGDALAALPYFDRANELDVTLAPHNWQRGVALGCAGKFSEGADQFRLHHEVNPDDVENSAWYFLCVAKTKGKAAAEAALIPSRGDRRQPMMSVLKMLQGTLAPNEVLTAAETSTKAGPERKLAMFYGLLYVGLYYDSIGESEKAIATLERSISVADTDYMGRTARIYRQHRFDNSPSSSSKPSAPAK